MTFTKHLQTTLTLSVLVLFALPASLQAVTGLCVNCHTMHNSQNGVAVDATGTNNFLTNSDCVGCHAQGTGATKIVSIGGSDFPQVYHDDASGDLAGGNFAYIDGTKASPYGPKSETYGHNIIDLFGLNSDANLDTPPGSNHVFVTDSNLTCAGNHGCHGSRASGNPAYVGIRAVSGAHHANEGGSLTDADTIANSYRFLYRVKGFENQGADKWQNKAAANNHNEYFGDITPMTDSMTECSNCHSFSRRAPLNQTISGFCATCHGVFHDLKGTTQSEDLASPFVRHPNDVILPNSGEYSAYSTYNPLAPPGRPDAGIGSGSSTVTAGTDMVTCISCHLSHASPYPDMLRWDYDGNCFAETPNANCGCFVCHTEKDD